MESRKRTSCCSAVQETKFQVCFLLHSQKERGKDRGCTRGMGSDGAYRNEVGISAATVHHLPEQPQNSHTLAIATTSACYPKPSGHCWIPSTKTEKGLLFHMLFAE